MADTADNKKKMIQALEKTAGIVTEACERVGISRDTHYRWLKEDWKYKAAVDDINNVALDLAEGKLIEQIKEGNTTAIIFYLKTKGKNRGYIERVQEEIKYTDATPIESASDLSRLTEEELLQVHALLLKATDKDDLPEYLKNLYVDTDSFNGAPIDDGTGD